MIVLDASAILAYMFREASYTEVGKVINHSCLSTVNLSEVLNRFVRDGHDVDEVLRKIQLSPVEIIPFTAAHAAIAARLLPSTQPRGLSLGDRACLALALDRNLPAMTADQTWLELDIAVEIKVIR